MPDEGDIFIDGRRGNDLSPNQRHVNIVFQSFALFPHMTAWDNVAFGLKMKKTDRAEIRDREPSSCWMRISATTAPSIPQKKTLPALIFRWISARPS